MASSSTRDDGPVEQRGGHFRFGGARDQEISERERAAGSALRFGLGTAAVAIGWLIVAAAWAGTCSGNTVDVLACGRPQLTVLALAGPALLAGGGLWALLRCYQSWRDNRWYGAWLGAGWFLLAVLLVVLTARTPDFTGPVISL